MDFIFEPPQPIAAVTTFGRAWPVGRVFRVAPLIEGADDVAIAVRSAEAAAPAAPVLDQLAPADDWTAAAALVVAIGYDGADLDEDRAVGHIWGYAAGLDLTRRERLAALRVAGAPWDAAIEGPHTAPLGPISAAEETGVMLRGGLRLHLNGALHAQSALDALAWSAPAAIAALSRRLALRAGDLIFLPSTRDAAPLALGDVLRAEVDGLAPLDVSMTPPPAPEGDE